MGVHNLAEYVAYHQAKLREQNQAQSQAQSTPKRALNRGVNQLHSSTSFQTSVIEGSSNNLVLLDCFATWCGPCKAIAPAISGLSNEPEYKDKVEFYKIDVDEVSDVAADLGIRAMPTFLLFKNGEKVEEIVGANLPAVKQAINKHL
jgi:thioredoxin 1